MEGSLAGGHLGFKKEELQAGNVKELSELVGEVLQETKAYEELYQRSIPVFAAGGGISYVLRPSFGFLLGFIVTAFCSGWIMEHGQRNWRTCFLASLAGLLATYGIGLAYKYMLLNYYTGTEISFYFLLLSCFPLDLPGDILFSVLAAYAALRFPVSVRHGIKREGVYAKQIQK